MNIFVKQHTEQKAFTERSMQFGFFAIIKLLRRNWFLLVLCTLLGFGAAQGALRIITEKYAARSTIILAHVETRLNSTETRIENSDTSAVRVETEIDFLRSLEFAREVADDLDLISDPYFNPFLASADPAAISTDRQYSTVLARMLKAYTVERRGESLALDISVLHPDPAMSARVANSIAENYIESALEAKQAAVQYSISQLRDRISVLGGRLSEMEIRVTELIRDNELDDTDLGDELRAEASRLNSILTLARQQNAPLKEIAETEKRLDEVQSALDRRTRADLTLIKLQRSLDADLAGYQALVDRRNALESQVDFLLPNARQVTVATARTSPSSPDRTKVNALGIAGGLMFGIVLMLLREVFDRRVWTGRQVQEFLGLRTIAYIPQLQNWRKRDKPQAIFNRTAENENSPFHLALQSLLTLVSNQSEQKDSMILAVTSALAGEGKSTLTLSLAISAAQEGHRVLMIDLDVHRHGLTRMSDVDIPKRSPREVWQNIQTIQKHIVPCKQFGRVDLLSFSSGAVVPRRLFDSEQGKEALEKLRESYDIILVDTAPVLASDEANRLAPLADFAILIARWGRTPEDALGTAAEALNLNHVPLAGVVLNDVDPRRYSLHDYGGYRAGGYYAYNAGYGYQTPQTGKGANDSGTAHG